MNRIDIDFLAGEYAIGTLGGPELEAFRAELVRDPAIQLQVAAWERRLIPLATLVPPISPRAELWENIVAALDAAGPPATLTVRGQEGEWRMVAPGAEIKMLWVDLKAGFQSFLLRLAPGCQLPTHDHGALEECLLLEGDMLIGHREYAKGDYHAALSGSRHETISSRNGGLVFIRSELRPELMDA